MITIRASRKAIKTIRTYLESKGIVHTHKSGQVQVEHLPPDSLHYIRGVVTVSGRI